MGGQICFLDKRLEGKLFYDHVQSLSLSLPLSLSHTIRTQEVEELEQVGVALPEHDLLALHLLLDRRAGRPEALAIPDSFDLPVLWEAEDLAALQGSNVGELAMSLRRETEEEHRQLLERLEPGSGLADLLTWEDYLWARCACWSRQVWELLPAHHALLAL